MHKAAQPEVYIPYYSLSAPEMLQDFYALRGGQKSGILMGTNLNERGAPSMVTYMIPCLLGLEKLVADEVKRLGL